jgi:hypothetical protein
MQMPQTRKCANALNPQAQNNQSANTNEKGRLTDFATVISKIAAAMWDVVWDARLRLH